MLAHVDTLAMVWTASWSISLYHCWWIQILAYILLPPSFLSTISWKKDKSMHGQNIKTTILLSAKACSNNAWWRWPMGGGRMEAILIIKFCQIIIQRFWEGWKTCMGITKYGITQNIESVSMKREIHVLCGGPVWSKN